MTTTKRHGEVKMQPILAPDCVCLLSQLGYAPSRACLPSMQYTSSSHVLPPNKTTRNNASCSRKRCLVERALDQEQPVLPKTANPAALYKMHLPSSRCWKL